MKHLIAVLIVLMAVLPVSAQEETDQEALTTYVGNSIEALKAQGSYKVNMQQEMAQSMSMPEMGTLDMSATGKTELQLGYSPTQDLEKMQGSYTLQIDSTGSMTAGIFAGTMGVDIRLVDEIYYLRYTLDLGDPTMNNAFPQGWLSISLDDLRELYASLPGFDDIDLNTLLETSNFTNFGGTQVILPVTPQSVETIVELEPEPVNGETWRVFDITIDYNGLITPEQRAQFNAFMFAIAADIPQLNMDSFLDAIADNYSVQQRVWIHADDNLPRKVEITIDGSLSEALAILFEGLEDLPPGSTSTDFQAFTDMDISQKQHITSSFSAFGQPFQVEAPANTQPFLDVMPGGAGLGEL